MGAQTIVAITAAVKTRRACARDAGWRWVPDGASSVDFRAFPAPAAPLAVPRIPKTRRRVAEGVGAVLGAVPSAQVLVNRARALTER
ncbi:MAG: hypothetical protein U0610_31105 [bacterium]